MKIKAKIELFIALALFALVHDTAGDRVVAYEGMDQATIVTLIAKTGFTFDFIDEAAYTAFLASNQPIPETPAQVLAYQRSGALAHLDSPDPSAKELRGILFVLIDELNILRQRDNDRAVDVAAATTFANLKTRWALRSSLADRNMSQVKPAIQGKISSGSAD